MELLLAPFIPFAIAVVVAYLVSKKVAAERARAAQNRPASNPAPGRPFGQPPFGRPSTMSAPGRAPFAPQAQRESLFPADPYYTSEGYATGDYLHGEGYGHDELGGHDGSLPPMTAPEGGYALSEVATVQQDAAQSEALQAILGPWDLKRMIIAQEIMERRPNRMVRKL